MAYTSDRSREINPYLVGNRVYGGGRSVPNLGPVDDKLGYKERDRKNAARRQALLNRLKAAQSQNFGSANYLRSF